MFEDDPSADQFDVYGKFYNAETHVFTCIDDQFESDMEKRSKKIKLDAKKRKKRLLAKLSHSSQAK